MVIAAIGQLCSTASLSHNLALAKILVKKAVDAGAKVAHQNHLIKLTLDPTRSYIASSPSEGLSIAQPMETSIFVLGLKEAAKQSSLAINVGIHVPTPEGKKVLNRSCWIDEHGEIKPGHIYDKLHLFDYGAGKESNSVQAGNEIVAPIDTVVGRVGLTICFDLRFPELSLALKRQNAQIISYPSAFTVPTGQAHWETLLRARAIETQAYVVAAAQVGQHNEKRISYGHSMVVDPWGKVLVNLTGEGTETEIATFEIDLDYREKIKASMPLLRRTDVYPEI